MKKNKNGYFVKNNIIYVQGTIDNKFTRYSTKKQDTKLNLIWIKKNARDVLLQLYNEKVNKQSIITTNFIKFSELSFELNAVDRKEATNKDYKSVFENYIKKHFRNYSLENIKKSDLQNWQNNMIKTSLSIGRIKFIRAVFSGLLTDAFQNDLIDENPFSKLKAPKRKGEVSNEILPFSLDEIEKIINASAGQEKNLITTLFFTGLRTGELWGLKWSDINFVNKTIHIQRSIRHKIIGSTKTVSSNRIIEILPIVEEALTKQKAFTLINDSYVFLNKNKEHFASAQHLSNGYWKNVLKFCNLDYRVLYQTRHSFASMMISKGEDIVWVSKTLGHSSAKITLDIYTKYIPNQNKVRATFLNDFSLKNCTKTAHAKLKFIQSS